MVGPSPYTVFCTCYISTRTRFTSAPQARRRWHLHALYRTDRPVYFDRCCSSWGFPRFVKRDEIEGAHLSTLDDDDSIHVCCIIDVLQKKPQKKKKNVVTVPCRTLRRMPWTSSGAAGRRSTSSSPWMTPSSRRTSSWSPRGPIGSRW
jgi:hypothetical protein